MSTMAQFPKMALAVAVLALAGCGGGGGGGGGGSSAAGGSTGSFAAPPAPSAGNPPQAGFVAPPSGGSTLTQTSNLSITTQPITEAANVPDGGASVILLGSGMLAVFLLRRRLMKS